MTIRVPVDSLPRAVREAIARGDTIEFESDGSVAAVIHPRQTSAPIDLWDALSKLPPLDAEFEADIAELDVVTRPQESAWER